MKTLILLLSLWWVTAGASATGPKTAAGIVAEENARAEAEAAEALLAGARARVAALRQAGARRLAPRSSERAVALLRAAEAELARDRTAGEAIGNLAAEAEAAADRALALSALLREARSRDATEEDLLLDWQAGLDELAKAAGTTAEPTVAPPAATRQLTAAVADLRVEKERLARDLSEREREIVALEEEIRELDQQLQGASSEARDASLRLADRDRAREQFGRLEQLFSPSEALVLRQGDALILRLRGLAFAPGSAQLPVDGTALLDKVAQAAALYPAARVTVEGHTDSSGASLANQRLSQARAEAVQKFLATRPGTLAGPISAVGYGDTRPIARNEESAGRRDNRRIDLVIVPPAGSLP